MRAGSQLLAAALVALMRGVTALQLMELETETKQRPATWPTWPSTPITPENIRQTPLGQYEVLSPPVTYGNGQYTVTGLEMAITQQRTGYAYQGIPFAEPPIGELRFMPPVKKAPFGSINTTYEAPACPQSGLLKSDDEDCLYLNVYTPKLPNATVDVKMPVMVFIYGGAFTEGGGQLYYPNRLQEKHDVVVVTIQYRLGVLGFFTTMTDDAPGNQAMYDQVLALEWTRDNIAPFGGDPNKVTIFGESAGGASVSLLLVSPLAKGLFHRAIAESGSSLVDWAYNADPALTTRQIVSNTTCKYDVPPAQLVSCMRNINASALVDLGDNFATSERLVARNGFDGLNPVIQPDTLTVPRFLPQDPYVMLQQGNFNKVPTIHGVNKNEGSFVFGLMYNDYLKKNNLVNDTDFLKNTAITKMLQAFHIMDYTEGVTNAIKDKYFSYVGDNWDINTMYPGMEDLTGLFGMKSGARMAAELISAAGVNSYTYSFQYRGLYTMALFLFLGPKTLPFDTGVTHADELLYLFPIPLLSLLPEADKAVSLNMVQMWVDFATHGDPTPPGSPLVVNGPGNRWLPVSEDHAYLEITSELTLKHDLAQTFNIAVQEAINDTITTTVAPATSTLTSTTPSGPTPSPCQAEVDDLTSQRDTFRGVTIGLAVVAVLVVLVGAVLVARARRSRPGKISTEVHM